MTGEIVSQPTVWFAHGKESGPWGLKITALAEVARNLGYAIHSPDFQGMPHTAERVAHLLAQHPTGQPLVLAGSSMGGYVAMMASTQLPCSGLFLMAPAVWLPVDGYSDRPALNTQDICVVHGWQDEIIPVEPVMEFSRHHNAQLTLTYDQHALAESLPVLEREFSALLERCLGLRNRV